MMLMIGKGKKDDDDSEGKSLGERDGGSDSDLCVKAAAKVLEAKTPEAMHTALKDWSAANKLKSDEDSDY